MQGNDIVSSANAVSGLVYKKQNDVVYYFGLRKMNDSLLNENARLRQLVEQYKSLDTLKDTIVYSKTEIGDTATVFGLTMNRWSRAWQGILVGMLNKEEQGRHFTNHAYHHKEEFLFQGTQSGDISGGAVLNGNG
jgi:hypothetical protein